MVAEMVISQMLVLGQKDLDWFETNLSSFRKKYNNKYIAFRNKNIIDVDSNLDKLMIKVEGKEEDTSSVIVKFVTNVRAIL
jgi:predicted transport protein